MGSLDILRGTDLAIEVCAQPHLDLVRPVLERVVDKWSIIILTVLCERPKRFNEIKRLIDGITHKALADALKRMERYGLVTRTVLPTSPIGVQYAITPLGLSLRGPFEALCDWALSNRDVITQASVRYDLIRSST